MSRRHSSDASASPATPIRRAPAAAILTWLLWIAIIAVLLFLVVSPFVYLVVTSFQAEKHRRLHLRQLRHRLRPRALRRGAVQLAAAGRGCGRPGRRLRRAARLGGVAHRHAGHAASCACWCWRPSSRRPTPARSPGSCWPGPTPAGSTASRCSLTGAEAGPFNIYSFTGLAVVIALYSFPYIFIFTSAALELVSSEMEDAANILGAGTWRTMRRVTLPLALPAILGGADHLLPRGDRAVRLAGA